MRTVLHSRLIVLSVCMIWLNCFQSPEYRYSLKTMGAVTPKKPPRGVCFANWGSFANRLRREMPAGAARTEGIASAACFAQQNCPVSLCETWGSAPQKKLRICCLFRANPLAFFSGL